MIYFISDTHFDHGNIIKYCHRPFLSEADRQVLEANGGNWHNGIWKDPENNSPASQYRISKEGIRMMNDTLIDEINRIVGTNDTLWHLGDVLFGHQKSYIDRAFELRGRIRCKNVNLILGNHDQPRWTNARGQKLNDVFDYVDKFEEIVHRGTNITLCHYALAVFNKSHRRGIDLYGHSHAGAEGWMDRHMPNRRSMDVGVDNINRLFGAYRPISMDEIFDFMRNQSGHFMDHHVAKDAPTEEELQSPS